MSSDKKIIKFPGTIVPHEGQASTNPASKMTVGPMTFFCTNCGETCEANFKKMIFRSVEFYCVGCGEPFRVTNPAFGTTKPKK